MDKDYTHFELEDGITGIVHDIRDDENYRPPDITYLDDVENECWRLFKAYASIAGVEFDSKDETEIDFSIAKDISEHIIAVVENTFNVNFPLSAEEYNLPTTIETDETFDCSLRSDEDEWER